MTKLGTLKKTMTVTKNPAAGLLLKRSNKRKSIRFRNGFTFQLTWPQFRVIRDNYALMKNFSITQEGENLFRIKANESEVICAISQAPLICDLMGAYTIDQIGSDLFRARDAKTELVGSYCMLGCLQELKTGEYSCNCLGKVVLDVGGYQGETAVFFSSLGARKVIVYEPVEAHIEFIAKNAKLNNVSLEIHNEGIGNHDGIQTVNYTEENTSFGLEISGPKTIEIKVKNVSKIIEESGAEIAKFDCEGAEISLMDVPDEILRKIEHYLIEVHSRDLRRLIIEKFRNARFFVEKETLKPPQYAVLSLKRLN